MPDVQTAVLEAPVALAAPTGLAGRLLGEVLVALAKLDPAVLADALRAQGAAESGRIGEILVQRKVVSEEDVARALAAQLDLPFAARISVEHVDVELARAVPINFAKQSRLLPLRREEGAVVVAVADPLDTPALDHARMLVGASLLPVVVPAAAIVDAINAVYDRALNEAEQLVGEMEAQDDLDSVAHELEEPQDLLEADDEAPIIRLVNSLLFRAAKERASDIHIEPMERDLIVRFRIDGVLNEVIKPPKRYQNSIVSRVKVMGQLNIAEKRLPQDGRIRIKLAGRDGIVLVTGPTGSGKTTTLYAALSIINTPDLNILTVEDPVEYQLQGISQMAINPKIGLTFAAGLRSFLRQDPDVIMVGEIRDRDTAEIAIQASLTGHLVFSTVHTNDSAGAITRLVDMGVEPFLVASSLTAVLAQRLVRRLCNLCREAHVPTAEELAEIGMTPEQVVRAGSPPVYRAVGCSACGQTGYRGRTGIYEFLPVDDDIRTLAIKNVDSNTIKKQAVKRGMTTLLDDGARKVLAGETTIAEVLSVTQEDM